jgi:Pyruvate/2-oxoacid:ferredoxin oxidoreductase gamma subunit
MLGAVAAITNIVSAQSLEATVAQRFDERFKQANLSALNLGMELARKA